MHLSRAAERHAPAPFDPISPQTASTPHAQQVAAAALVALCSACERNAHASDAANAFAAGYTLRSAVERRRCASAAIRRLLRRPTS